MAPPNSRTLDAWASGQLTAVDLFAGAGGFSLGLLSCGFRVIGAADNWAPAVASYRANFPDHRLIGVDLGEISGHRLTRALGVVAGEVDLVVGGPPCQGFSIQRIGPDHDARNHLVLCFAEHVSALRPRMFIMENVAGLLGRRGRELVRSFEARLRTAGYTVARALVDAQDYGVPQRRKRVVFCGWLPTVPPPMWPPPSSGARRTVRDAIGDLPPPPKDPTEETDDPLHRRSRLSELNLKRLRYIPPGGGFEDLPVDLRVNCHKGGAARIGHRNVYGRLDPDAPAATITARFDSFTRGQFAHPAEDRNITLREGARLQTFPDGFKFTGNREEIAAQIGNAVPPLLAELLVRTARASLLGERAVLSGGSVQLSLTAESG